MLTSAQVLQIANALPPPWPAVFVALNQLGTIDAVLNLEATTAPLFQTFADLDTLITDLQPLLSVIPNALSLANAPFPLSVLTVDFNLPDVTLTNQITVTSTAWLIPGNIIAIGTTGSWIYLQVQSIIDGFNAVLVNVGCAGVTLGSTVTAGNFMTAKIPPD